MAKKPNDRTNDLSERTLADRPDTIADKYTEADLGRRSTVMTPARPPLDPDQAAAAHAVRISTDLHARSGHPTLAERIAREGWAAQMTGSKPPPASKQKPKG